MTRIDSSSLLQMRSAILQQNAALQKAAQKPAEQAPIAGLGAAGPQAPANFTKAFGDALSAVNELQAKAGAASESYERGETTDIAAVMLQREQANLGFQATLQVRNKLLAAYKDIMSMPV
ncbi:flagellar hook-basal body complex subunit FliE [Sphingomonas sp. MM-1]|uniref:flagellar hook-basal body complex protein FliE n=1 Tax=Sphingomonas sp. MM-1 TaxID=745310 RepID=UPI0002C0896E|nr:flagellar hook-basal body complex protein FliE [Sphingomonas sp. MM-1]AGH48915.1 flagellar hook-basal body complex subunit FliE [Sphingomonas sp. MM-1]